MKKNTFFKYQGISAVEVTSATVVNYSLVTLYTGKCITEFYFCTDRILSVHGTSESTSHALKCMQNASVYVERCYVLFTGCIN